MGIGAFFRVYMCINVIQTRTFFTVECIWTGYVNTRKETYTGVQKKPDGTPCVSGSYDTIL